LESIAESHGFKCSTKLDIWGHLKRHEIANRRPKDLGELSLHAIRALKRMCRRPTLVMAFWQQADLFPW
jgi:hypothetical protein